MSAAVETTTLVRMYEQIKRIREFELKTIRLFQDGVVPGFTHSYCGMEAVAVGAIWPLRPEDRLGSHHRGHGHMIAKGADTKTMMAEILGKEAGYCKGMGGELHIMDASLNVLGANGVVGGGLTIAVGAALADQLAGNENVTLCFFGDGASSQGAFGEALNMASIWKLPVVFICENNLYGEFSCADDVCAGRIHRRGEGYGIPGEEVDGQDVVAVRDAVSRAVDRARAGEGPTLIEAKTYRFHGHFYGEEVLTGGLPYRTDDEIKHWMDARDPATLTRQRCLDAGVPEEQLAAIDAAAREEAEAAAQFALESSPPPPEAALRYVYADAV